MRRQRWFRFWYLYHYQFLAVFWFSRLHSSTVDEFEVTTLGSSAISNSQCDVTSELCVGTCLFSFQQKSVDPLRTSSIEVPCLIQLIFNILRNSVISKEVFQERQSPWTYERTAASDMSEEGLKESEHRIHRVAPANNVDLSLFRSTQIFISSKFDDIYVGLPNLVFFYCTVRCVSRTLRGNEEILAHFSPSTVTLVHKHAACDYSI